MENNEIIERLAEFLHGETIKECPITIVSRDDIDGEDAELIRFTFGNSKQSCIAIAYGDGTVYTPRDWQTPVWDENGWTIESSDWMDCHLRDCVMFNGMPRRLAY